MTGRVLFYVQHLLGIGHVFRATRVAKGLVAAGFKVRVVLGGVPVPDMDLDHLDLVQLTPVRVKDEGFSQLLHPDGRDFTANDEQKRAAHLLREFNTFNPDVLITEAFPFGRRQLRFELLPLLEAANKRVPKPLVVASIRDIMQENRAPNRVQESLETFRSSFDLLLVHGDPNLIVIEDTLQGVPQILDRVRYTGLVCPPPISPFAKPSVAADIVISVGGGAIGDPLRKCAFDAMRLSKLRDLNWCMTTGINLSEDEFTRLCAEAPANMQVVRFLPDLAAVMASAKVSVSQAGYNTVADVLRAGCPAVLVPFAGGVESEQLRRARLLDQLGRAVLVEPNKLEPATLCQAIERAVKGVDTTAAIDLEGAANSAAILIRELTGSSAGNIGHTRA